MILFRNNTAPRRLIITKITNTINENILILTIDISCARKKELQMSLKKYPLPKPKDFLFICINSPVLRIEKAYKYRS